MPDGLTTAIVPEYLDIGEGDGLAFRGTRNQAKSFISGMAGVAYRDVRVRRKWMRPCDCDACQEVGPVMAHDYDSYWIFCERSHPDAVAWWVG